MNQSQSTTGCKVLASLIILSIAAIAAIAFASYTRSNVAQATLGDEPTFNRLAKNFAIQTDDQGTINNVSSSGGRWERDFLRVGRDWNRQGDFPGNNNELEICEDGATFSLWGYVHNTRATSLNHNNQAALDFQGSAVANNTTVRITSDDLNQNTFANRHEFTLTVDADNATSQTDTVEIYCDGHAIKVVSTGVTTPRVHSWSSLAINKVNHDRAVEVFGADYSITNPDEIFTNGSQIGYDGHLPACRYYATYLEIELKVIIADSSPAPTGSIEPTANQLSDARSAIVPDTAASSSDNLNYGLITLIAGSAIGLTIVQRATVARARRQ